MDPTFYFKMWQKSFNFNFQFQKEERIEESRKFVDDETKFFDENVEQNVGQIHETQLERWKDAIMNYIQDSKAMRAKEDEVYISFINQLMLTLESQCLPVLG